MITLEQWGEITRRTMITQRRKDAERLDARAALMDDGQTYFMGQTKAGILTDAIIARWEADTLERDGKLPDDYMAILECP